MLPLQGPQVSLLVGELRSRMLPPKDIECLNGFEKTRHNSMYLQEIHFSSKNTQRFKVKGYKMIFHDSGDQKSRVVTFTSEKASVSSVQFSRSVMSDSL